MLKCLAVLKALQVLLLLFAHGYIMGACDLRPSRFAPLVRRVQVHVTPTIQRIPSAKKKSNKKTHSH